MSQEIFKSISEALWQLVKSDATWQAQKQIVTTMEGK
jgi:hypothetical protein